MPITATPDVTTDASVDLGVLFDRTLPCQAHAYHCVQQATWRGTLICGSCATARSVLLCTEHRAVAIEELRPVVLPNGAVKMSTCDGCGGSVTPDNITWSKP